MPEEEIESSTSEEKGWLGKIKDSIYQNWQTILVALIVLIVGISAYNYNQQAGTKSTETTNQEENKQDTNTDTAATTENKEENTEATDQAAATQTQTPETTTPTTDDTAQSAQETKTVETNTNTTTNTAESTGEGYKIIAEKGEGITRLARKALEKYLSEHNDSELTASHKVYIEDYLQNRIGSQGIEIGHTETISKKSIEEAIAASKQLSQASLNNLKKYTVQ